MKKYVVIGVGFLVLLIVLFFCLRPSSFDKELAKVQKELTEYHMVGTMEVMQGEDTKLYNVDIAWKEKDNQDYYRVSLYDQDLNQEQIVLKNQDGVFVVTPSLNQAFRFKGDWPNDSPKPYLFQTMLDITNGEHTKKKLEDGYLISADVTYPTNPNLVKEEIKFSKDMKPQYVRILNMDGYEEIVLTFTDVDFNPEFGDGYFQVNDNLKNNATQMTSASIELPLYPVMVYDARLTGSTKATVGSEQRHILEFTGDKNFTIVETKREKSEEPSTITVSGELVDGIDSFAIYEGNSLTLYNQQVEFTIYSEDLSADEMLQVVSSMRVAVMAK